jgi:hypothetical protein
MTPEERLAAQDAFEAEIERALIDSHWGKEVKRQWLRSFIRGDFQRLVRLADEPAPPGLRALERHGPLVDYGRGTFSCVCGEFEGNEPWMEHLRAALAAVLGERE